MQSKQFTDQQILTILKEGESPNNTIIDVCRKHGVSDRTYYKWRKKYGGVEDGAALRELKALRNENERLKKECNLFGVDAELAVVYKWSENADVDIHLYSEEYGYYCAFNEPNTPFAKYLRDETQATEDSYEMIYQTKLVPGTYRVYINLYKGTYANPNGYIHVLPGTANDRKYNLGSKELTEEDMFSNGVFVRSFRVSSNGISLL